MRSGDATVSTIPVYKTASLPCLAPFGPETWSVSPVIQSDGPLDYSGNNQQLSAAVASVSRARGRAQRDATTFLTVVT